EPWLDDRPATGPRHGAPARTDGKGITVDDDREARLARLRDPRTYATVGEWYNAYRGFVPIQTAHALSRLIQRRGITFAEAYDHLVGVGTIIEIGPVPPAGPAIRDTPPARRWSRFRR
ncbi:MAG TPA: hypothetical protein VIH37_11620, partial [Candidatus Limnocylindrales bacterium]